MHDALCASCGSLFCIQRLNRFDFEARTVGPWAYAFFIGLRGFALAMLSTLPFHAVQ